MLLLWFLSVLLSLRPCEVWATAPPADQQVDRIFVPGRNESIDMHDFNNLVPQYTIKLLFYEQPRSFLAMSTTMDMIYPAITIENSAHVRTLDCSSDGRITISLSSAEAFAIAQGWPKQDLVLVTNDPSCNPANERGVFLAQDIEHDFNLLTLHMEVSPVSWRDVAKTMAIDYLQMEPAVPAAQASSTPQYLREEL